MSNAIGWYETRANQVRLMGEAKDAAEKEIERLRIGEELWHWCIGAKPSANILKCCVPAVALMMLLRETST